MKFDPTLPASTQIEAAARHDIPLVFDLREERMGDKCAATAMLDWLAPRVNHITVVESDAGKTPFILSDKYERDNVSFTVEQPYEVLDGLDIHARGHSIGSFWVLNNYFASQNVRPRIKRLGRKHGRIVFALLPNVPYHERREMDLDCALETKRILESEGFQVDILSERPLDGTLQLPMNEALEHIAGASVFIGGDTGFSHYAAAIGIPQIALYPDWSRYGKFSYAEANAISRFWQIPFTVGSYLPNNPHCHFIELGSDHCWSIEQIVHSCHELCNLPATNATPSAPNSILQSV